MRKSNIVFYFQKFGQKLSIKASKGPKKFLLCRIVSLSSLISNSEACNEK